MMKAVYYLWTTATLISRVVVVDGNTQLSMLQEEQLKEEEEGVVLDLEQWEPCGKTSKQFMEVGPEEDVKPCIMYDIKPPSPPMSEYTNTTHPSFTVTLVQATPSASACYNMRDGALVAVELLNAQNNHRGIPVGFYKDYYIQFRLVSVVAGNANYKSRQYYADRHTAVLDATVAAIRPHYIIGTCSFFSGSELEVALKHETMLVAQVGPPNYYKTGNPWIFGMHISSDQYPIPALQALRFQVLEQSTNTPEYQSPMEGLAQQPISVVYRSVSEFFYSTCRSAIDTAKHLGFTNIQELEYHPDEDHNEDGTKNQFDPVFLRELADRACPPGTSAQQRPAIFACFLSEQDIVFERLRENGCRPISLWLTAATWKWGSDNNPSQIPYIQGGGQWHKAFQYSDDFYKSGQELLEKSQDRFEYFGSYDFVVSYSIPMLFAEHIKVTYRVIDHPTPALDFGTPEGYEKIRRGMVVLDADTLFGHVSFDEDQRNVGRDPAGTQWLPISTTAESATKASSGTNHSQSQQQKHYQNKLVSPSLQAEAIIAVPAPSATTCPPGSFVNQTLVTNGTALLTNKCSKCPVDTITYNNSQLYQCFPCPLGSNTEAREGETRCYTVDENLISKPVLIFGYCLVAMAWTMGIVFAVWLFQHQNNPVVRISQVPFMILIIVGAIVSSSTTIALSWQAGADEDPTPATMACRAVPFLYTIGWVLQYGSLTAKTYRLHKIMNQQNYQRVTVTAAQTSWIVAVVLAMDLIIVIVWTLTQPLEYRREVTNLSFGGEDEHLVTVSSYGSCSAPKGSTFWVFVGPIATIHFVLVIVTNALLYRVRDLEDRYQEGKYVALASIFVFEILIVGVPVLFSVGDSRDAVFLVLAGIIALNDIGTLCFIFVPKMLFQRQGLEPGVTVGESIHKSAHKKAIMREENLSQRSIVSSRPRNSSGVLSSFAPSMISTFEDLNDHKRTHEQKESRPSGGYSPEDLRRTYFDERQSLLEQENQYLKEQIEILRTQQHIAPKEQFVVEADTHPPKENCNDCNGLGGTNDGSCCGDKDTGASSFSSGFGEP